MNQQKPGFFMPALIGGAAAGVLSAVPFLGCLCCLWIIGGALLATYLVSKDSTVRLTAGDGAVIGVLTGIVAAVVDALLSIPLQALNNEIFQRVMERLSDFSSDFSSNWKDLMERGMQETSAAWFMLGLVISAVLFAALGAVGGLIGVSLYGKKAAAQPPQQGGPDVPQDPGHRQP